MKFTHIVIHHSFSPDRDTSDWASIRRYHLSKGWSDVGYHWGIEKIGRDWEILAGRPMTKRGAHCTNARMNRVGVGVCLIGNYDEGPPAEPALKQLEKLCLWLRDDYGIGKVIGHREAGLMDGFDWKLGHFKSCPGSRFDLDAFRNRVGI